jgi:hypothetical protein
VTFGVLFVHCYICCCSCILLLLLLFAIQRSAHCLLPVVVVLFHGIHLADFVDLLDYVTVRNVVVIVTLVLFVVMLITRLFHVIIVMRFGVLLIR